MSPQADDVRGGFAMRAGVQILVIVVASAIALALILGLDIDTEWIQWLVVGLAVAVCYTAALVIQRRRSGGGSA